VCGISPENQELTRKKKTESLASPQKKSLLSPKYLKTSFSTKHVADYVNKVRKRPEKMNPPNPQDAEDTSGSLPSPCPCFPQMGAPPVDGAAATPVERGVAVIVGAMDVHRGKADRRISSAVRDDRPGASIPLDRSNCIIGGSVITFPLPSPVDLNHATPSSLFFSSTFRCTPPPKGAKAKSNQNPPAQK